MNNPLVNRRLNKKIESVAKKKTSNSKTLSKKIGFPINLEKMFKKKSNTTRNNENSKSNVKSVVNCVPKKKIKKKKDDVIYINNVESSDTIYTNISCSNKSSSLKKKTVNKQKIITSTHSPIKSSNKSICIENKNVDFENKKKKLVISRTPSFATDCLTTNVVNHDSIGKRNYFFFLHFVKFFTQYIIFFF